jgi:tetratricopeptide (TPR) repeat protein
MTEAMRASFLVAVTSRIIRASLASIVLLQVINAETMPASYAAELAEVHARYGQHERARDLFIEAIAGEKDAASRASYRSSLAGELSACGNVAEATSLLEELSRDANPVVAANAQMSLAKIAAEDGHADEAIDLLAAVAGDCPIHELRRSALTVLVTLAREHAKAEQIVSVLRLRLATEPQNEDLLEVALTICDDKTRVEIAAAAAAAHPDEVALRLRLARALAEAQRFDEATETYRAIIRDVPDVEKEACEGMAHIAAARDDVDGLTAAVEQAAAEMPDGIQRDLYLTRTYAELEAWDAAEHMARLAYARAEKIGPAMVTATAMELGEALAHLGRHDEARTFLQPVAEQNTWHGLRIRAEQLLAMQESGPASSEQ